ncbi:MAG: PAS domain-containing protein [Burkholderiales bacterium]|nr:PAS domain-containing protein [Burkholderiales bacterium]
MRRNLPVTQVEYPLPVGTTLVSKTDLKGKITYCNPAFVEVSGFDKDELLGAPHNLIRHPDMPAAAFADLWATVGKGLQWTGVVKNRRKNGDHYWVVANVTPMLDQGRVTGYLSVRTMPSREEIAAAESLYARMNEGRLRGVALRNGYLRRTGPLGLVTHFSDLKLRRRLALVSLLDAVSMATIAALAITGAPTLWLAAVSGVAVVLTLATGVYINHAVADPVHQALGVARALASGSVSIRASSPRADALGLLLRALTQTSINILGVLTDIRGAMFRIGGASAKLSQGMRGLASRTESQAASVQQTSATMEELTATVRQNADNATQAYELATQASRIADRGGGTVRDVVATMDSINASSRKIREIIGVIDGIAFQTNILALNAAVEAARAGEQGRGFAVVAGEVRALAQRSASAAREIKDLITASVGEVDRGAAQVREAGTTMDEMVAAVQRVSDLMSEISSASREQSSGIEQVGQAIVQIDEITQQNAALVQQTLADTERVAGELEWLTSATEVFDLGDRLPAQAPAPATRPAAAIDPKVRRFLDDAVAAHAKWKLRLHHYLKGAEPPPDPSEVRRDDACALGQWLCDEGDAFAGTPEYAKLKTEHSAFHHCAADVVEHIRRGDRAGAQAMLSGSGAFARQSTRVVQAIEAVRESV